MARRTTTAEVAARVFGERVVTVVDAGGRAVARKGWYRLLPLASLVGFEADAAERDRLVRLSAPGVERYEWALLGERDDEVEVAHAERGDAALVGALDERLLGRFPSLRELRPRAGARVRRRRLDEALREAGADEPIFLRLSSWGGELEALRGAGAHLDRMLGVEIDVVFAPLTSAQPHFSEVDALLRSRGLALWRLGWPQHAPERHWTRLTHADTALFGSVASERAAGSGRLLRARALYLRDHEALAADEPLRLGALAALCDAAGEIDMAAACLGRLAAQRGALDEPARQALAAHLRALERE